MEATTKTLWKVDPTHSEVQFKVKHLVISTVTGSFNKFDGSLESTSEDFDGAEASFTIETASVDTNQQDRDAHLQSGDFFDSENHPNISFKGNLKKVSDDGYKLVGPLTI